MSKKITKELKEAAEKHGGKSIKLFSDKELVARAKGNHLWMNGFSCIRPSDEFAAQVGRQVISMVMRSDMRDSFGISRMEILTVNCS